MTKEEYDMLVDGKPVKQVVRRNPDGKKVDVMFRIKKGNSGLSAHIVPSKPEESHIDLFEDGQKVGVNRTAKPQSAGILFDFSTGKYVDLPPLVVDKILDIPKTGEEIARAYVKRVKWINR